MSTLWRNRLSKAMSRPGARDRRARLGVEGLEQRLALSVTSALVSGKLVVTGDGAADTVTLDHVNTTTTVNGKNFADALITNGISIDAGTGNDVVNLLASVKPVTVDGQDGFETVTLGRNGNSQGVLGSVFVKDTGTGLTSLDVRDETDAGKRTVSISRNDATDIVTVTGLTPGAITYIDARVNGLIRGGGGGNTFTINGSDTSGSMVIASGAGDDTINIQRGGSLSIGGEAGVNKFNIGFNGTTQGVRDLFLNSTGGVSDIVVDDSTDTVSRTVQVGFVKPGFSPAVTGLTTGLSAIHYSAFNTRQLTVSGGTGGNTITVIDTHVATTVNAGTGHDTVNVQRTSGLLDINGQGGLDTINVGHDGTARDVTGKLTITGGNKSIALNVDDSRDGIARNILMDVSPFTTPAGSGFVGLIEGLAAADIEYTPGHLRALSVKGGTAGNQFSFADRGPAVPTTLNTGIGIDTAFILATSGAVTVNGQANPDTVNIGLGGSLKQIKGAPHVTNTGSRTTLNVNGSADTNAMNVSMADTGALGQITGLAPAPITYVQNDLAALNLSGGNGGDTFTVGNTFSSTFTPIPTTINTGSGNDTINVQRTTQPLLIDTGTGTDTVNLGLNGSVQAIKGALSIISPKSNNQQPPISVAVFVNNQADTQGRGVELNTSILEGLGGLRFGGTLKGLAPAQIDYPTDTLRELRIRGGGGGNTFTVLDTGGNSTFNPVSKLETGGGADTVDVRRTTAPIDINTQGGTNAVNLGNIQNFTSAILGAVNVSSTGGSAVLNINDQSSNAGHADVTLSSRTTGGTLFGEVLGQLPGGAGISYVAAQVSALNLNANPAGNRFTINDAVAGNTTLNTGTGFDTVDINGTTKPLTVNGQSGLDNVIIGRIGTVQNIKGELTIRNTSSRSHLIVDDRFDPTARNVTMGVSNGFGTIAGLAPGLIKYVAADVSNVFVDAGNAGNTFTVQDTIDNGVKPVTTIDSGTGIDIVNVQGTTGALTINGQNSRDTVNVGLNDSMQSIKGTLRITNFGSRTAINLNNQADTVGRTVVMGVNLDPNVLQGSIIGLAPAVIFYKTPDLSTLTVNTGSGADTFKVSDTVLNGAPANTVINSGGGNDTVNVFATTGPLTVNAGAGGDIINIGSIFNTLESIQGALTVNGQGESDTLNVNDQGSTSAHIYNVTPTQVQRSSAATITYSSIESLKVNKGPTPTGPLAKDLEFKPAIRAGRFARISGRLEDSDAADTLSLIVDWGDGSTPHQSTPDREPFALKHRYTEAGTYTVRVIWTDGTGQSNFRDLHLTVKPLKENG